jgi:5-formyltetrahydrofolate cyclo-ligase
LIESNGDKTPEISLEPEERSSDIIECRSPPCMLHELDPAFMEFPDRSPAIDTGEDWEEIRMWRRLKRGQLIKRRLAMPAADRVAHSDAITAALVDQILPDFSSTLIGFYWPFKGEYDPRSLARSLHSKGARLALPVVVEKARPLIFREWWPGIRMTKGVWNIPIPENGSKVVPDILLVPLVGCDQRRHRLGYGGGYYDRTLAVLPTRPRLVGIGFELSRIATIYPQPHDIAMDLIVTERRIM